MRGTWAELWNCAAAHLQWCDAAASHRTTALTTPSPILGGFGISRSSNASDSEEVNLFLELIAGKDGRAPGWLQMAPGLDLRITVGAGPIRGLKVMAGFLYAVSGNAVYQIGSTLSSTKIGTISTSAGPVSMIQNGTQLVIFDSYSGWLTTAALALNGGVTLTGGTISDGGLNYAIGDNITLIGSQGQGDATAIITVNAVSTGGVATAFSVVQPGLFSSEPTTFNQASTTDSGSGFVLSSPSFGASGGLSQISLPFSGGPVSATYQDGFGVVNDSLSNYWYQSDLFDLSIWGPLNFAQANSQPDNVKALVDLNREVFVIKDDHTEVWINAGVAGFTFQRLEGVFIEYGTDAPFSVAKAGQSIVLLTQNEQGGKEIRRIMGYEPKRISTHAVEQEIAKYPTTADAEAYSYNQDGHLFYVIGFPSGDTTFVCDLTDSEMAGQYLWHKRASIESPITGEIDGNFHRHWGACYATWPSGSAQYQPKGVVMVRGQQIATAAELQGQPASFTTALFSEWCYLPNEGDLKGLLFGNGGVQITVANDTSSPAGQQILVTLLDQDWTPIVVATYAWTSWAGWVWIGISMDTRTQTLQVFVGDQHLAATSIAWMSSNPINNNAGAPWSLSPLTGV